jgi:hypothetical protein
MSSRIKRRSKRMLASASRIIAGLPARGLLTTSQLTLLLKACRMLRQAAGAGGEE